MAYNKTMSAAIQTSGLSKKYSAKGPLAINQLSLNVQDREIYGFLGPNGAGKSTTIRLLLNFIQPSSGYATINGLDIVKDGLEIKRSVGYIPSDMGIYKKMTGDQYLKYMAELRGGISKSYLKQLLRRLRVEGDKKLGDLSRGNRQKINIVQAFMHEPKILIFDEPTSGLDPLMQEEFFALTKEAKQKGSTIFMSSHILSEVQKTCDRVGIIREGVLVDEKTISELANEASQTFDLIFSGKPPVKELKLVKGVKRLSEKDGRVTLHYHGDLPVLLAKLSNYTITSIETRQLDLEEVFMHYYQSSGEVKQ